MQCVPEGDPRTWRATLQPRMDGADFRGLLVLRAMGGRVDEHFAVSTGAPHSESVGCRGAVLAAGQCNRERLRPSALVFSVVDRSSGVREFRWKQPRFDERGL